MTAVENNKRGLIWALLFAVALHSGCTRQPPTVTVVQVLENPSKWQEKQIWLSGYMVDSAKFEAPALIWSDASEASKSDLAPSIRVSRLTGAQTHAKWRSPFKGDVLILGIFRQVDFDPLSPLHIEEIEDIEYP